MTGRGRSGDLTQLEPHVEVVLDEVDPVLDLLEVQRFGDAHVSVAKKPVIDVSLPSSPNVP